MAQDKITKGRGKVPGEEVARIKHFGRTQNHSEKVHRNTWQYKMVVKTKSQKETTEEVMGMNLLAGLVKRKGEECVVTKPCCCNTLR